MKAATTPKRQKPKHIKISIHAAREGGDAHRMSNCATYIISIHAAREGGDFQSTLHTQQFYGFQSTPPVKAATASAAQLELERIISIHAAREGGDASTA